MKTALFWLKNRLLRKAAMAQYKKALLSDTLSDEELRNLNWIKRKAIVMYAYTHSAFYKRFYDEYHFAPSMLQSEADWSLVPILEKDDVRKFREEIRDVTVPSKYIGTATTGGSTGIPLKVFIDKRFHFEIMGWRAFRWWGISPADHVGIIHRSVPSSFFSQLINRCMWWPTRRVYLNASSMTAEDICKFVHELKNKRIKWIVGYVGGIEKVVDYVLTNNIQLESVRMVWSTSAPLLDFVRRKIEKAFGCSVMDQYGCNEITHIAVQCPQCKELHVNSDYVHVDVVDEANGLCKVGKYGDLLVTNLESKAFPLIKYRLGDKSALSPDKCSCGLPYPLLKPVSGRITDSVLTPSGLILESIYLTSIFDDYTEYVQNFRIYQKADYSVTVYVVLEKTLQIEGLKVLENIKKTLSRKVKGEIPVIVECVDVLNDNRGKNRYVISEIANLINK